MEKQPVLKRIVLPAGIVLGLMVCSINLYNISRWWEPQWLHDSVAHLSAAGMFLSISQLTKKPQHSTRPKVRLYAAGPISSPSTSVRLKTFESIVY